MKLHLPVMLRRSLLALIALLSPAVVTTTFATATLAAITAPTMAEDLDLTLDSTYEFSGSVSFDSVTTGSPNDSIKATAMNSTFTANTVSVGTGHMLTVEGDNHLRETDFTVKELNVAEGGFINFTDGTYVRAASGVTLYDLFKGVSSGSVKGTEFYIYGAGHSAAETEKLVKSSDLFGKLHSAAQGFIYITEGNLIIDADNTSASGGGCHLYIGDNEEGSTDAFATITDDVTRFDYLYVESDGKLTIEKSSEKLTLKNLRVDGSLESHRDLVLEGTCTIVGKLTLGGTIENNGTVRLELGVQRSFITVDSSSFAEEHITHTYTDGDNGYLSGVKYTVITGTGTLTGRAFWFVDGMRATYKDGKVIVEYDSPDTAVYYVASGTIDYGTDVTDLETDTTKFCMKGGSLVLSKNLKDTQGIKVDVASSVSINNDVTLKASQLDASAADVTLSGGGSYTMTNGANTLGSGVSVGSGWSGTVNTTGDTTALELNTLGVSGSNVVLGSNSHTLAARDQSVAANITSTGSISLTGYTLTLSGTNSLGSVSVGSLEITGGSTAISNGLTTDSISGTVSVTGGTLQEMTAGSAISTSGTVALSNVTLGAVLNNSGTLNLGGTINVDSTALTSGTRERYSNEDNGYKTVDTTYTVLTGNAATGTATWKVGTDSATYEDGLVIVAGIEDKSVYYVRDGDVDYTQSLAQATTIFNLEGGHLVLNESLKDTQSIEWKSTDSWLSINNDAVELKSSQLSTVGAGNFTLIAPNGGTYIIDKKVGDIVELTLGTGVTLSDEHWWGWVKTVGDTTVSSDLDTTGWKNTELNGATTVNSGVTLTLGGNTKLKGQIVNNGTLVLGGNIDVRSSIAHVTNYTYATTDDASDLGSESGSGFASSLDVYSVVEGNSATGSATWTVDGQAAHYDSGKVSLLTGKDTTTWWMNSSAAYSTISGNFVTGSTMSLALNTENGTLQLDTAPGVKLVSKKTTTVEIADTVTLNANQLDASAAEVTLTGSGSYTMADGANTLGAGVRVGSDWSGTVKTAGNTTALELDKLGVSGSKVVLGNASHTLAVRDQEVAANLNSTGSVSLEGKKLTLSGSNTLGSLNVGSLAITGGSTTITNGLTIGGESSVATGATLSLSGNSTLGGKITNSGTLELGGNITVNKDTFKPGEAVKNVTGYFIGSSRTPNSTNSGFEAACWDITIAEGGTIIDNGATWKLVGDEKATFDFEDDGTLHAYGSGVGTVFHVAKDDTITYSESNAADFVNSKGEAVSAIQLNGGTLELGSALATTVKSAAASSVVIANGVTLNASQLDTSAAAVTLSGKGGYTLGASANALNTGVGLSDTGWRGTVKLTGAADALELSSLGNALSSIDLDSFDHTLADGAHVINSALMGSGSLMLNKGSKLTLNGDCSNWSGDIIGQVELELTEGGTIGGNVQVDSLHIGESSTTFEGKLTTTGTITVSENATLSLNEKANTTLGGKITNSGTLELDGNITVNKDTFNPGDAVKNVTGYFIGSSRTPNSTNSGFEAACWDITIAEGGTIIDNGATWKLVGDEKATFDFAADGTLHAYGSGVGTVFHVAKGDTITYSESNAADFVNSKDTEATAISLNGGTLVLNTDLRNTADDYVKSAAASSVVIADGVTLNASQLDTSAADVTLRGKGSYTMQGQELSDVVELNTGVTLDANEWKGTVYTGSTEQGAALDITALGNSQSTVYLGAQPMRRSMPGETVLKSLTAAGVGTTETPGALTLQKGTSTADNLVVNGILTLGTTNTAARLEADSVRLQELNFAHADSRLVTGKLESATTLNVQLTDEVLSNKDAGETLPLVKLEKRFKGALTFNGSSETERVRSNDNRKEYTLAWNEDGTVLTLTILGTETYVTEQVAPTTGNGRAGVALMTDVFLNSRPQKEAPDGALAGILNAVDAGTATDRDMAAVAGASTAALGMALSGDVERQLRAIRNRSLAGNDAATVTLVDEKSGMVSSEASTRFFAWVNAEGNRAEQDDDSTAAGYTLTSWGGTLGAGMQVNKQLTLGLALTAMYGDLQSDGPDYLKGDMDTAYLSAFARYNRGKWSHAFIGTAGTMEADYKRSAMSYSTDGDTDGTAFGLMYEVSREFELGNLSTLSPVFNIAYRHTAVDSYSESGADAALNVGKQSLDTVTAGAGARYAAVVGQRMLNRACGFEARALVKYDLGDRQSTTSTGFTGYATRAGIESAELGAFGVELGAGISVPVGSGSIFADGAVELRSDYTNFNATVGYKIQF